MSAVTQRYRLDVAPDRGEGTAQNNAGPAPRGVGDDARRIDRRPRKPVNHSPFKNCSFWLQCSLRSFIVP